MPSYLDARKPGVLSVEFKVITTIGNVFVHGRSKRSLTVCTADFLAIEGDKELCATMLATMFCAI
jgi:hypothetical protein